MKNCICVEKKNIEAICKSNYFEDNYKWCDESKSTNVARTRRQNETTRRV